MLELMARGGMRVGEVLKLTPDDVQECSLSIQNPKNGRKSETVYDRVDLKLNALCFLQTSLATFANSMDILLLILSLIRFNVIITGLSGAFYC